MNAQIQATTSSSIAHRLQEAIELRGVSVVEFQRGLADVAKKMDVRGASYAQIHHYLQGRREPTLAVIRLAADLLEVREEWLAFGTGEPTELRETLRAYGEKETENDIKQILDATPELKACADSTQMMFYELLAEWVGTTSVAGDFDDSTDPERLARSLFTLITLPLHCWGFKREVPERYLVNMMTTLRVALADAGQGDAWDAFEFEPWPGLPLPVVFEDDSPAKAKRTAQQAKKKRAKTKRAARKSKKRGR